MAIIEYPKMENLFARDERMHAYASEYKLAEFGLVKSWYVTEKIDGMNTRIYWDGKQVTFAARKSLNPKDVPGDLRKLLEERFTPERLYAQFGEKEVTMFGEGFGAGIQSGGAYSKAKDFVLFDVNVAGWWLEPGNLKGIAYCCDVETVPVLGYHDTEHIVKTVEEGFFSALAEQRNGVHHLAEGVIARSVPSLFMRDGRRLMFKLKTNDFAKTGSVPLAA